MIRARPHPRFLLAFLACLLSGMASAEMSDTIQQVKPSVVVVGTYRKTDSPQFAMRGTGFVIASGNLIATNAHVVPDSSDPDAPALVIQSRNGSGETQVRRAHVVNKDREHDLAVLRIDGPSLPPPPAAQLRIGTRRPTGGIYRVPDRRGARLLAGDPSRYGVVDHSDCAAGGERAPS